MNKKYNPTLQKLCPTNIVLPYSSTTLKCYLSDIPLHVKNDKFIQHEWKQLEYIPCNQTSFVVISAVENELSPIND